MKVNKRLLPYFSEFFHTNNRQPYDEFVATTVQSIQLFSPYVYPSAPSRQRRRCLLASRASMKFNGFRVATFFDIIKSINEPPSTLPSKLRASAG